MVIFSPHLFLYTASFRASEFILNPYWVTKSSAQSVNFFENYSFRENQKQKRFVMPSAFIWNKSKRRCDADQCWGTRKGERNWRSEGKPRLKGMTMKNKNYIFESRFWFWALFPRIVRQFFYLLLSIRPFCFGRSINLSINISFYISLYLFMYITFKPLISIA